MRHKKRGGEERNPSYINAITVTWLLFKTKLRVFRRIYQFAQVCHRRLVERAVALEVSGFSGWFLLFLLLAESGLDPFELCLEQVLWQQNRLR